MFHRVFVAHPDSLGESYFQHQRAAFAYAGALLAAGVAAAVHGLIPCLFETTATRAVSALHARMQARAGQRRPARATPDLVIAQGASHDRA